MIKNELKKKVIEESRELLFLTIFLSLFLISLTLYHGLLLGTSIFTFFHIGYNFIEAVLLAKIILLGKMFHLGTRYADKSLYIPTLHKTFLFGFFVFIFSVLEHFVEGLLKGNTLAIVWSDFTSQGIKVIVGKLLITFVVFILLFSFLELSRVVGEEKVFNLFFRRKKS